MKLKLKTNGKINPVGVNKENVILSVEGDFSADSYYFEIFNSKTDAALCRPMADFTCKNGYFHPDGAFFSDCREYFWRATAFVGNEKVFSDLAKFETAISDGNFLSEWVENPSFDGHVSEFVKRFTVRGKISNARLYIVGLGFYRSFINGKETDDFYFKPVLTDFDKRENLNNADYCEENFDTDKKTVCYNVFDVTDKLTEGENTISVLLGTGWYCNTDKLITDPSFNYGTPKLLFELHIETENGQIVISDENCYVRNTAIRSQLFFGDEIDFTKPEENFTACKLAKAPSGKLIVSETENDIVIEKIAPVAVKNESGTIELDFGKNHTGRLYLKVKGKRGAKLTVRYYESKKNGVLNPYTSRWDAYEFVTKKKVGYLDQQGVYTLSGEEDEIKPYFSWCGYRYATVECDGDFEIKEVLSYFITADVEQDGDFTCSDRTLNELHRAFILTQRGNMHCGVPSDCPHREKLPYTGDGQLVAESVSYLFNAENFYRKWLKDIIAAQGKNGFIPYTAPYIAGGGGYWWSNAVCVIPFVIYSMTGDDAVLFEALPACLKLIEYYGTAHDGDFIVTKSYLSWCLGDWLAPEVMNADKDFINTLAYYFAVDKTAKICDILGKNAEKIRLYNLKVKIAAAVNEKFFDAENLKYCNGIQGENLLPALFDIVPEDYKRAFAIKTISYYESNPHFDTGIVLTPRLLDFLSENGRSDLAVKILTAKTPPSFYDMLRGETTLCEHWYKRWPGSKDGNVSHNHPMFGSVLAWVYKRVAGLDLSALCEKKIFFTPEVTGIVSYASAHKNTRFGLAKISYEREGEKITINLSVPKGVTGVLSLTEFSGNMIVNGKLVSSEKSGRYEIALVGGNYKITNV